MARKGGWQRRGSKRRGFRYYDSRGKEITDPAKLARIDALRIPPAWREVCVSPRPTAKVQATGLDAAGRRQYLYHPEFRAAQEQAKYDKLIRFAEHLPVIRAVMVEHMKQPVTHPDHVCAVAVRLINHAWFRAGSERFAKTSRTYGVTTLQKRHVKFRGSRVTFGFRAKHKIFVRTTLVDEELATALRELAALAGGSRLFRYERDGILHNLTNAQLNAYIREHMGEEFTAKDFRTWGGTLTAAIAFAEAPPAESAAQAKRVVASVMRRVGDRLGNTAAVARASYVSPAVVEQYLDGTTIEDFRPRHLRVVGARDIGLDREEQALLSLLRSWRIKRARLAA